MNEREYTEAVERLYENDLRPRMVETLERLGEEFRAADFTVSGPLDLSTDDFRWYIHLERDGLPESVYVSLEVAESAQYDGTLAGVNMCLDIVANGGEILGGLTPYNYTDSVWVDVTDRAAVLERCALVFNAEPSAAVALVEEYAARSRRAAEVAP